MKTLLYPRASTAVNDAYTGPEGQVTVDRTRWEIRLHDNVTPGGHRILSLTQLLLIFMSKDSEFGEVAFAEEELGYLVRIGDRQYELREITGQQGIIVVDGLATNGNTIIKVDPAWLAKQVTDMTAGGIRHFYTGGSATALTITVPFLNPAYDPTDEESDEEEYIDDEAWPREAITGTLIGITPHLDVKNTATLSINGQAGKPIIFPGPHSNIQQSLLMNHNFILMLVNTSWVVIGMQQAVTTPITLIEGVNVSDAVVGPPAVAAVPARNVQEALEALKRLIGGGGDSVVSGPGWAWKFGAATPYVGALTSQLAALAHSQAFLLIFPQVIAPLPYEGGSTGVAQATIATRLYAVVVNISGTRYMGYSSFTHQEAVNTFITPHDPAAIYTLPPKLKPFALGGILGDSATGNFSGLLTPKASLFTFPED